MLVTFNVCFECSIIIHHYQRQLFFVANAVDIVMFLVLSCPELNQVYHQVPLHCCNTTKLLLWHFARKNPPVRNFTVKKNKKNSFIVKPSYMLTIMDIGTVKGSNRVLHLYAAKNKDKS